MSIIFLDIDGVLNYNRMPKDEIIKDSTIHRMSTKCVGYLNEITDATDAKIVVSSTWRKDTRKGNLSGRLHSFGITGDIIGQTPDLSQIGVYRGNEIDLWMIQNTDLIGYKHSFSNYVILDDDSDMLLWQADNYIQIDPWSGITPQTVWKVKQKLML